MTEAPLIDNHRNGTRGSMLIDSEPVELIIDGLEDQTISQ